MTIVKISDLDELTLAATDDLLPIVDTSVSETKKITIANFLYPLSTKPNLTGFSWVNQGSATITLNSDIIGSYYMYAPAVAGDQIRCYIKTAPTRPYDVTVCIIPLVHNANYNSVGIGWRQSSDGKLVPFYGSTIGANVRIMWYADPQTSVGNYLNTLAVSSVNPIWLRIHEDADNGSPQRICYWSLDGMNFIQLHTVSRTDYMTADQIMLCVNSNNATYPCGMTILSYEET